MASPRLQCSGGVRGRFHGDSFARARQPAATFDRGVATLWYRINPIYTSAQRLKIRRGLGEGLRPPQIRTYPSYAAVLSALSHFLPLKKCYSWLSHGFRRRSANCLPNNYPKLHAGRFSSRDGKEHERTTYFTTGSMATTSTAPPHARAGRGAIRFRCDSGASGAGGLQHSPSRSTSANCA